ncbi:MAG TPA: hypothetical protein VMF89_07215, partial [Polyangiales bacterium]|nr:hypothetical protein [Polyangiales bacterium]
MGKLALLALFCALAVPLSAAADDAEYTRATERGLEEFGERNFEEARAQFLRAHALSPSARTLRAVGMVEFELKNYADSVRYLEEALDSSVRPLEQARRKEVEALLETANTYVARYTLRVAPANAELLLDGSKIERAALLVLDIGTHQLELRATGRMTERRTLKVKGGEHENLTVKLAALQASPESTTDSGSALQRDDTAAKKPLYK